MKYSSWSWLALLVLPGCLLVQPLDEAKSGSGGAGGATAAGGSHSGGQGPGGAGRAGSGPSPSAGAPAGGAPAAGGAPSSGGASPGPNFSLFTGIWYPTSGTVSTSCDFSTPSVTALDINYYDQFDLGTTSDLIFDATASCPIDADVDNRTASDKPNQLDQGCTLTDSGSTYEITLTGFDFVVDANGKTAESTTTTDTFVTDPDTMTHSCTQETHVFHSRTAPP